MWNKLDSDTTIGLVIYYYSRMDEAEDLFYQILKGENYGTY